jgi:hypothetical protein
VNIPYLDDHLISELFVLTSNGPLDCFIINKILYVTLLYKNVLA